MDKTAELIGHLPVCAIEGNHPAMLIGTPQRDTSLDTQTNCEYTANTETWD